MAEKQPRRSGAEPDRLAKKPYGLIQAKALKRLSATRLLIHPVVPFQLVPVVSTGSGMPVQ